MVGQYPRSTNVTSFDFSSQLSTVHLPDSFSDSLALIFINILISFYGRIASIITRARIRPTSPLFALAILYHRFETNNLRRKSLRRAPYAQRIILSASFNPRILPLDLSYSPKSTMLCDACQEIFRGDLDLQKQDFRRPHHRTSESLLGAVRQGCYICRKFWVTYI